MAGRRTGAVDGRPVTQPALRIAADDLTGALDSAAAFTGRYGPLGVNLAGPPIWPPDTAVVDLGTREREVADARRIAGLNAGWLADAAISFRKLDSLLRGPWPAELAAAMAGEAFTALVLAPAFPAQRRITLDGLQLAPDPAGYMVPVGPPPAAVLRAHGLRVHRLRAGAEALFLPIRGDGDPPTALLCDAADDDDLAAIVDRAHGIAGKVLWCGSAGLAQALAGIPATALALPPGPYLALIGSDHPVSREQVAQAGAALASSWVRITDGGPADRARITRSLADGAALVTVALPPGTVPAEATPRVNGALQAAALGLPPPGLLIAAGGETLHGLGRALGGSRLEVVGEWAPGLPLSRFVDGRWAGTSVLSKSGAFGSPDLLAHLLALARRRV